MGHSQEQKAQTRALILEETSRRIRGSGLESVRIGDIMNSLGLTNGGFYRHFESREALLNEALKDAIRRGSSRALPSERKSTPKAPKQQPKTSASRSQYVGLVKRYLSKTHRLERDTGCAIAALNSDVGRASDTAKKSMEDHVQGFIAMVSDSTKNKEEAMLVVSALVGALSLSRIYEDEEEADKFLIAVRNQILELEDREA